MLHGSTARLPRPHLSPPARPGLLAAICRGQRPAPPQTSREFCGRGAAAAILGEGRASPGERRSGSVGSPRSYRGCSRWPGAPWAGRGASPSSAVLGPRGPERPPCPAVAPPPPGCLQVPCPALPARAGTKLSGDISGEKPHFYSSRCKAISPGISVALNG